MFKNNNQYLVSVKKLLLVLHIFLGIVGVIICAMITSHSGAPLLFPLGIILLCLLLKVSWTFTCVVLSYFQDIKLIRNKLYDVKEDEVITMFDEE